MYTSHISKSRAHRAHGTTAKSDQMGEVYHFAEHIIESFAQQCKITLSKEMTQFIDTM